MIQSAGNSRHVPKVGNAALLEIVCSDSADPSARQNARGMRDTASKQTAHLTGARRLIHSRIPPGQQTVPDPGAEQTNTFDCLRRKFASSEVYPQTAVRQHENDTVFRPRHGTDAAQGVQYSAPFTGVQDVSVGAQSQCCLLYTSDAADELITV